MDDMSLTNFDNALSLDRFFVNVRYGFCPFFFKAMRQILVLVRELNYCFTERGKAKIA